jgi:hypothetical protein
MQTEQPQLVGEVSAYFCGYKVPRGQRNGSLRPYSRISRPNPLRFLPSSSLILFIRLSGPRSRPTTSQIILAPGIEPGPLDLYPGTLTSRPQRRSTFFYITGAEHYSRSH